MSRVFVMAFKFCACVRAGEYSTVWYVTVVYSDISLLGGGYSSEGGYSIGLCAVFTFWTSMWRQALETAMTIAQGALWLLRVVFKNLFSTTFN